MAQFSGTFFSNALQRKVPFTAIIPTNDDTNSVHEGQKHSHQPKKTLHLLHGWDGSDEDWLLNVRIYELASERNIAIILPVGENSFYVDHANGNEYGRFIGEDLLDKTREIFHLSKEREDTWIAGLSMGGYGALSNGFKYSETFGKVATFSSRVLSRRDAPNEERLDDHLINLRLKAIIGSDTLADLASENDPYELVLNRKAGQDLFLACGLEDIIYKENKAFHEYLSEQKIDHKYIELPGGHDWDFWNEIIVKAVDWMLEK